MRSAIVYICAGTVAILFSHVALSQSPPIASATSVLLGSEAPSIEDGEKAYPITLAVALQLANARPLDVAMAARQVDLAAKQYERARLLWVPNLVVGTDYFRHEGGQQNFAGDILRSSRGSAAFGLGPNIVFSTGDAIYAPLAARQDLFARTAFRQAITNDTMLAVAEAYFTVQQARAELVGAQFARIQAEEVAKKTIALAEGLAPPLEASRAKVELARRKQAVTIARERWRIGSAELGRLLRLDATTIIEPTESPFLSITLIGEGHTLDQLIPIALTNRPELSGHQALILATLARLKQEKLRPLMPSLALRSTSTNPSGSIAFGSFGGGPNDRMGNFGTRFDLDVQLLWEFSALGLGNRVRVGERKVENQMATLELFRTQDRIAAEVAMAFAQWKSASERLREAEPAVQESVELVSKAIAGMGQTRRVGEFLTLVVRPLEVIAAVQALAQANTDYAVTIGDYNRAQFRLYRALGHPASAVANAPLNVAH